MAEDKKIQNLANRISKILDNAEKFVSIYSKTKIEKCEHYLHKVSEPFKDFCEAILSKDPVYVAVNQRKTAVEKQYQETVGEYEHLNKEKW